MTSFSLIHWASFLQAAEEAGAVISQSSVAKARAHEVAAAQLRIAAGWHPQRPFTDPNGVLWVMLVPPKDGPVEIVEVLPPKELDVVLVEAAVYQRNDFAESSLDIPADVVMLRIPAEEARRVSPEHLGLEARLRPNTNVPQRTWSVVVFRGPGWDRIRVY